MAIDCNNTVDEGEIAICSCKKQVDSMKKKIEAYNSEKEVYETKLASWNKWHESYIDIENRKKNIINEKKYKELSDIEMKWNNCVIHSPATMEKHDWCNNDLKHSNISKGESIWYHKRDDQDNCIWTQKKGVCALTHEGKEKLTLEAIDKELGFSEWNIDNKPTPPSLPSGDIINCCSDIADFSDNLDTINNTTKCNNVLNKKLNVDGGSSEDVKQEVKKSTPEKEYENYLIYIITVVLIILGIGGFVFFKKSKK